jgi:hypothetical protein
MKVMAASESRASKPLLGSPMGTVAVNIAAAACLVQPVTNTGFIHYKASLDAARE